VTNGVGGTGATYASLLLQAPEYLAWEHGALTDPRVLNPLQ